MSGLSLLTHLSRLCSRAAATVEELTVAHSTSDNATYAPTCRSRRPVEDSVNTLSHQIADKILGCRHHDVNQKVLTDRLSAIAGVCREELLTKRLLAL